MERAILHSDLNCFYCIPYASYDIIIIGEQSTESHSWERSCGWLLFCPKGGAHELSQGWIPRTDMVHPQVQDGQAVP